MNATEPTTGIPPGLAAELREALDDLATGVRRPEKMRAAGDTVAGPDGVRLTTRRADCGVAVLMLIGFWEWTCRLIHYEHDRQRARPDRSERQWPLRLSIDRVRFS